MAKIKMDADTRRFRKWLRDCETGIPRELKLSLERCTESCWDLARQLVPKDTRNLHNHIMWEMQAGGTVGRVYVTGVHYARYVEQGTMYRNPTPYMRTAYNVMSQTFVDQAREILHDYLRKR